MKLISLVVILAVSVNCILASSVPEAENANKTQVIIIGAGVSGIAAATELRKSGDFNVQILEGSERIGGRIRREKLGDTYFELGAEWVHGEKGNKVYELMKDSGLLINDEGQYKSMLLITSKGEVLDNITKTLFEEFLENVLATSSSELKEKPTGIESSASKAERLWGNFIKEKEIQIRDSLKAALMDVLHAKSNSWEGSDDWSMTSASSTAYVTAEGNQNIYWKYPAMWQSFLKFLLTGNAAGDPGNINLPDWIHFNKKVSKITYSVEGDESSPVKIEVRGDKMCTADHVISTVSLGVMKENMKTLFHPALSQKKMKAIEELGFGSVNKIFLEFEPRWWSDDFKGFSPVWEDNIKFERYYDPNWRMNATRPLLEWKFDGVPLWVRSIGSIFVSNANPNVLETLITGSASRYIEHLGQSQIAEGLMPMLVKFLVPARKNISLITNPKRVLNSKWASNDLIRGSYSFVTVKSNENDVSAKDLEEPILDATEKPVVCFAGEATSIHQYSTVHGAYASGLREAKRIINFYSNSGLTNHQLQFSSIIVAFGSVLLSFMSRYDL